MDIYSGYCQVVEEEEAHEILAFFALDGKQRWKVMHMGSLNADPKFVAMMMKLQMKWYTLAKESGLKIDASKIIVDDVLLCGHTANHILAYFRTVVGVLKHHSATLKLKKCRTFQDRCEFVVMNVAAGGTKYVQSQPEVFSTFSDQIHG